MEGFCEGRSVVTLLSPSEWGKPLPAGRQASSPNERGKAFRPVP